MKEITRDELNEILRKHDLWLKGDFNGARANLNGANLYGANLYGANLNGANLYGANLYGANLYGADLNGADLNGANLYGANLIRADLIRADLNGANLRGANLRGAKNLNFPIACPEKGSFIGFKKCQNNMIVKLEITEDALRCSATGRKCRCSKAKVLSITNLDGTESNIEFVSSKRDPYFIYKVGKIVEVKDFDTNRWNECSTGIHFFITRQEAVDY